jgi:hypothetical protein
MPNTLAGGKAMVFSVLSATYGYIQSYSVEHSVERAEARGPGGHVMAVQQYNDTKKLALEYLEFASQSGMPALSATFSFDDGTGSAVTWYINSISYGKTVDGFKTVSVDATNYPNLATP